MVEDEIIPQEKLIDVSQEQANSETESEEAVRELKKWRSRNENKQDKKKSAKRTREETSEKDGVTQGPGPVIKKKKVAKELSNDERIDVLKNQRVLRGRENLLLGTNQG